MVYDFGSGTFDLTLVEYERADSYAIKERDGDDRFGSTDIDLALLEYVILRVQIDFNFDLREEIEKNERKKAMLLRRCEKVNGTLQQVVKTRLTLLTSSQKKTVRLLTSITMTMMKYSFQ